MRTTTVSQLKMSLSAYLRRMNAGEEVVITERGRPIVRLLPLAGQAAIPKHLKDLGAQGLLKPGTKPLPTDFWDLPRPADPRGSIRAALIREREEGR